MKKINALAFFLLSFLIATAQVKYPASAIPASLLKDANVVKRAEEVQFEIKNLHDIIYRHKFALTILNEQGQDEARLVEGYDKLQEIENIEGTLYDASGNQLRKVKTKDIGDFSNSSAGTLYADSRIKTYDFNYKIFPYTVEYEVVVKFNHSYYFPNWIPQDNEKLAVEQSTCTVVFPESYNLRYKAFNYKADPITAKQSGKQFLTWEVKNLQGISRPFASPQWYELTASVFFAPSEFELQGYKGNATSWEEYGKFQLLLNENRDKLPDDIVSQVVQLAQSVPEIKEKVKKLYEYFQAHTRYISIQLGIGGWQPFEASFVAQKGYGDCKALSNYMFSLLKAAGIKSYYTKIHAGETADDKYLMEDFPSNQSNHIILCVPLAKDTMWLECTSQTDPAGYMGGFTGNRKALVITEDGGKLVSTPSYTAKENVQLRSLKGIVDESGNLTMNIATSYTGTQQDYYDYKINALSKDKVKQFLNERLDLSSYEVKDFAYQSKKSRLPELDESLKLDVTNYATVSGRRLFIGPNIMNKSGKRLTVDDTRKWDYVIDNAYRDIDSVEIAVPAGYTLEAVQPDVKLVTPFGTYSSKVKLEGDKIIYYRNMEQWSGRYPG